MKEAVNQYLVYFQKIFTPMKERKTNSRGIRKILQVGFEVSTRNAGSYLERKKHLDTHHRPRTTSSSENPSSLAYIFEDTQAEAE